MACSPPNSNLGVLVFFSFFFFRGGGVQWCPFQPPPPPKKKKEKRKESISTQPKTGTRQKDEPCKPQLSPPGVVLQSAEWHHSGLVTQPRSAGTCQTKLTPSFRTKRRSWYAGVRGAWGSSKKPADSAQTSVEAQPKNYPNPPPHLCQSGMSEPEWQTNPNGLRPSTASSMPEAPLRWQPKRILHVDLHRASH